MRLFVICYWGGRVRNPEVREVDAGKVVGDACCIGHRRDACAPFPVGELGKGGEHE